jgi:hypothetical protein
MLGAIYPQLAMKYAMDLKTARENLAATLDAGGNPELPFKALRAEMDAVWASGYVTQPVVRDEYELSMRLILHRVPEAVYVQQVESEAARTAERGGIGLGGILIGFGIGWFVFSHRKKKKGEK